MTTQIQTTIRGFQCNTPTEAIDLAKKAGSDFRAVSILGAMMVIHLEELSRVTESGIAYLSLQE